MLKPSALVLALSATLVPMLSLADQVFPATLAGHAVLPAQTFLAPPKDAPESLKISGKYTAPDGRRVDAAGSLVQPPAGLAQERHERFLVPAGEVPDGGNAPLAQTPARHLTHAP